MQAPTHTHQLELPTCRSTRQHAHGYLHSVFVVQVTVALQIVVTCRILVRVHVTEHPLYSSANQPVGDGKQVATIMRYERLSLADNLQQVSELTRVDQFAHAIIVG